MTVAHVPFPWLTDEVSTRELFNKSFTYGSYVRDSTLHLDFALIPICYTFSNFENGRKVFQFGDQKFGFGRGNLLTDVWKSLAEDLVGIAYKRGITTMETCGTFAEVDTSGAYMVKGNGNEIFSAPGDSGSLVLCLEENDNLLYPVGIHYAAEDDNSYCVPLWLIFYVLCAKQGVESVHMRFENPFLVGKVKFKCSDFQDHYDLLTKCTP